MPRLLALGLAIFALGALSIPAGAQARPKGRAGKKAPGLKVKAPEPAPEPAPAPAAAPPPTRGPTRIDFDDRLIQGQTNRAGAVYLYDRKELKTRSMVKKRESFREEIVGSVYDG